MSSIERAEKSLTKAKAEHEKWSAKLRDAKAKQAALAERHAEVDVTPEQADKIFAEQDAEEQRLLGIVEKIQPRIDRAAEKVAAAERDLIAAHGEAEQEKADVARSTWREHEAEAGRALSAYLDLEGVSSLGDLGYEQWRAARGEDGVTTRRIRLSKTRQLYDAFVSAQARVAAIRFYLETGELATKVSATGDSAGRWPATGRPLKPHERPEVIYGERSTAGEPKLAPRIGEPFGGPVTDPSKIRMGEPTW